MSQRYPNVFSPIKVGPVELRNRFFMPSHGIQLTAGGPHGSRVPSQDMVAYYAERAKGGVALLFTSIGVDPRGMIMNALYEDAMPSYAAVADAVHDNGAKIFGQLHYYYNQKNAWEPRAPGAPVMNPSTVAEFQHHYTCHEMTEREVEGFINLHVKAAANLAAAGYDGIEIHASHGMLSEQFLSPYFNKRADRFGGDLAGRALFLTEILRKVREVVGPNLAVGMRLNCDEMLPGGMTQDLSREVIQHVGSLGLVDYVNLDISVEPQQGPFMCASQFLPPMHMAGFIKSVAPAADKSIVVLGTPGRLNTVAQAEELLGEGHLQMVGAVRALIAEPFLLSQAEQGRENESRKCTACNYCIGSAGNGWGCTINPASGRELLWGSDRDEPAPQRGTVVVIGGGAAGLEAARTAALRGHRVVLFEERPSLGGQLALWATQPNRDPWFSTIEWYEERLSALDVEVRKATKATVADVLALKPQAVILATGARYVDDGQSGFIGEKIPGAELPFVYTPEQILEEGIRPTGRVLVLDDEGIATACGIAEMLAENGAQVELVTREFEPMPALFARLESMFIIPKLKSLGVTITATTYVKEIHPGKAIVYDIMLNTDEERAIDAVVLATMRKPVGLDMVRELEAAVDQVFIVGDAASARGITEATYEAHKFARMIGEPDAPKTFTEAWFAPTNLDVFVGLAPARRAPAGVRA